MRINSLKTFVAFCDQDCDTNTYKKLYIPRSTMWSHIDEVERFLNLTLIKRGRPNSLTTEGLRFLPIAKLFIQSFDQGMNQMKGSQENIEGTLCVSATRAATSWLVPLMAEFHDLYPNLHIKFKTHDHITEDLLKESHVVIHPFSPPQGFKTLWTLKYGLGLFASKDYLSRHGAPKKPENLKDHHMLAYGDTFSGFSEIDWHIAGTHGLPILTPKLTINSTRSLFDAALNGMGIISCPIESLEVYQSDLVRLLPTIEGPQVVTHFSGKESKNLKDRQMIQIFSSFFEENSSICQDGHYGYFSSPQ